MAIFRPMGSRLGFGGSGGVRVCEDFTPKSELLQEEDADILRLYLPDFNEEQLRVEVTRSGILSVSGKRPKKGDRWVRFHKEFPISADCNKNEISHEFKGGILFVRQPKLFTPAEKHDKLPAEPVHPQPQKPAADEQRKTEEEPSKKAEEQAKCEITANAAVSESGEQPSQPQKPAANEQKTGEEPSKKAKEQAKRKSAVSEPKKEEAKSTKGKASEFTDTKSATERSVEAKKSGSVVEDETTSKSTSTKNAAKIESSGTDLATMLRQPRKLLNVALVVLVVVGIDLYVNNMIRSSREAEE